MSSLGLNRRVVKVNRATATTKGPAPAKFEIFCDEDVAIPIKPTVAPPTTSQNAPQSATTGLMNPPMAGKKLQPLQAQPVHKNALPLGEQLHHHHNFRRTQMTTANLKKHDAQQLQSNQQLEQQPSSRASAANTTTANLNNLKHQHNSRSLRTSLSTSSDVSEFGIKTMTVEEAAEILQSRLAERTRQCNAALNKTLSLSPPTPMSIDGGSVSRRTSSSAIDFKENDISFSDQENDDTDIEDQDENRFYATDEDGFDGSDISLSDDVHDCSVNFDVSTIFKCDDYVTDIHDYIISLERSPAFRLNPNYMSYQDEIDSSMRCVLVDWMVDVADEHGLQHDTLFQAVNMVDRFLSVMGISTSSFQLLGVAALFTASKYEEIYPPDLYQFVNVTDKTYSAAQILNMEQLLLKAVDFRISGPTSYYFLCKIFTLNSLPVQVYHLAEYLCYLTMMEDQPFLEYFPSEIAISACILAVYQLGLKDLITEPMIEAFHKANSDQIERREKKTDKMTDRRTRSTASDHKLPLCIEAIHAMQEYAPSHKQKAIHNKFSSMTYDCVSNIKPLSNIQAVINL